MNTIKSLTRTVEIFPSTLSSQEDAEAAIDATIDALNEHALVALRSRTKRSATLAVQFAAEQEIKPLMEAAQSAACHVTSCAVLIDVIGRDLLDGPRYLGAEDIADLAADAADDAAVERWKEGRR